METLPAFIKNGEARLQTFKGRINRLYDPVTKTERPQDICTAGYYYTNDGFAVKINGQALATAGNSPEEALLTLQKLYGTNL